jgi:hypothetical protein
MPDAMTCWSLALVAIEPSNGSVTKKRLDQGARHLTRGREVPLHGGAEEHEVVVLERHGGKPARRRVAVVGAHADVVEHARVQDLPSAAVHRTYDRGLQQLGET